MKIAFIYDVIYPYVKGGAEKRFWELAMRLSLIGHEVHVFGMKSWQGPRYFINEGVHIHGIGSPQRLYLKSGIRNISQVLNFTVRILPALWRKKFDIIDCNAFPYLPFFPVRLYALLRNVPLIITWQEVWDTYWYIYLGRSRGRIARIIERAVIRLTDNVIVHSATTKGELIRCGGKAKNIKIIPAGVDLQAIEKTFVNSEKADVIFVGRLIREKNVGTLIKSIFLLKEELNKVKCIIIGGGPEKERLKNLAHKLNLNDNIFFKDFLTDDEEVISYMKSSEIFVFPSTREGFGIAVIEAMACGLPVITVSHPMNAATELIKSEENGFICQNNEKDVALRISQLINNTSLREAMSLKAKESIKDYDWGRIARSNEEFYGYAIRKQSLNEGAPGPNPRARSSF